MNACIKNKKGLKIHNYDVSVRCLLLSKMNVVSCVEKVTYVDSFLETSLVQHGMLKEMKWLMFYTLYTL